MQQTTLIKPLKVVKIIDLGFSLLTKALTTRLLFFIITISVLSGYLSSATNTSEILTGIINSSETSLDLSQIIVEPFTLFFFSIFNLALLLFLSVVFINVSIKVWLIGSCSLKTAILSSSPILLVKLVFLQAVILVSFAVRTFLTISLLLLINFSIFPPNAFLSLVCFLLGFLPGVIYFAKRMVATYALIVEKRGVFSALNRSKELMENSDSQSAFSLDTPVMRVSVVLILNFILSIIGGSLFTFSQHHAINSNVEFLSFAFLITVATQIPLLLLGLSKELMMIGFYFDLRCRKEGLDFFISLEKIDAANSE